MRTWQSVVAVLVFAQLLAASPSSEESGRSGDYAFEDRRVDPEAAAKLRAAFARSKEENAVTAAPFKFLGRWEDGTANYVFAAAKVSFTKDGIMCVEAKGIAAFEIEDGKEKLTARAVGESKVIECRFEFDKPVRCMNDITKAKVRFLKMNGVLFICARDKKLKPSAAFSR